MSDRLCDGGICTIGYDIQGDTASPTICLEMGQTSKERDGAGQTTEVADGDVSDRLCEGGGRVQEGMQQMVPTKRAQPVQPWAWSGQGQTTRNSAGTGWKTEEYDGDMSERLCDGGTSARG